MAEPFKNLLGEGPIRDMAVHLARVQPDFDQLGFVVHAIGGIDDLALKERSARITEALDLFLPDDYRAAAQILLDAVDPTIDQTLGEINRGTTQAGIAGWPVMATADYIKLRGQDDVAFSLEVLRQMTMRSSSEFAIREFLVRHQDFTLKTLHRWIDDPNEHVRRLVSEGSRPRLPWGQRLHQFVADPSPVLALLEGLKDDPSEYVRRSVANNLNDMAKDHPDLVSSIAEEWMNDASPERERLVRHALRSLIKAGHRDALETLGYGPAKVSLATFCVLTPEVTLGGALEFEIELLSDSNKDQPLMIDYTVHHMKANGKTTPKVFKWKTVTLKGGQTINGTRRHAMRPITTRRYYSGHHRVEIQVNGDTLGGADFDLHL